jgi:hypothetical protein
MLFVPHKPYILPFMNNVWMVSSLFYLNLVLFIWDIYCVYFCMFIRICVFIEEEQIGCERSVSVLLLTPLYVHGVFVFCIFKFCAICIHIAAFCV